MEIIKIEATPEIFDNIQHCDDRYNGCQFLENQWHFCTLFKMKLKFDKDIDGYTIKIKCTECKKSYQEALKNRAYNDLTAKDLHDDTYNDHL